MAKPLGVNLSGTVVPNDTADKYPITDPKWQIGGFRVVVDVNEMLAIPYERRKLKMLVMVNSGASLNHVFRLDNIGTVNNATVIGDWADLGTLDSGGGGSAYVGSPIDKIVVNAGTTGPNNGLPAPANGQRYLLVTNTANLETGWGSIPGVEDNDIVEYNGSNWVVSHDFNVDVTSGSFIYDTDTNKPYYSDGTSWQATEGSGAVYTNATPVPTTVGGIVAGTTFNAEPHSGMWSKLLYPFQNPTFSSFTFSDMGATTLELGDSIAAGNYNAAWNTTNKSNIVSNSIDIIDVSGGNAVLVNDTADDGAEQITVGSPISHGTNGSTQVFRIEGTDTDPDGGKIFSRTTTYYWRPRRYYGIIPASSLSALQAITTDAGLNAVPGIVLLNQGLSGSRYTGTTNFNLSSPGNAHIFWLYPESFGPTVFTQSGLNYPTNLITVVNYGNSFSVQLNYRLYISVNASSGNSIDVNLA